MSNKVKFYHFYGTEFVNIYPSTMESSQQPLMDVRALYNGFSNNISTKRCMDIYLRTANL